MLCPICNSEFTKSTGTINRAKKKNRKLYCSQKCSGFAHRKIISLEEKKRLKAEYDKQYREKNLEEIKLKKKEYFQKTYDPVQAAIDRKKTMPRHVEYCRRPEYKVWKKQYDHDYRYQIRFGEYAEAAKILYQLENSIDRLEANIENKTINKSQKRKRLWHKKNYLPKL